MWSHLKVHTMEYHAFGLTLSKKARYKIWSVKLAGLIQNRSNLQVRQQIHHAFHQLFFGYYNRLNLTHKTCKQEWKLQMTVWQFKTTQVDALGFIFCLLGFYLVKCSTSPICVQTSKLQFHQYWQFHPWHWSPAFLYLGSKLE